MEVSQWIMRKPEVLKITGLCDTTIWRLEKKGDFPKRLKLGGNSCGWISSEVFGWIAERSAARDEIAKPFQGLTNGGAR
ncbi:MAG: AlpA family transcriptional regulator [Chlorobium sp.]|nr:AlpA family transcriptional regulator [Chlorobium sp.]